MCVHIDEPLKIENVARDLGMSVSGFPHHFKSFTAMSPLQYQKQIRLQESRRLRLAGDLDAASAGFKVGYEIHRTSAVTTKNNSAPLRNATRGFAATSKFEALRQDTKPVKE